MSTEEGEEDLSKNFASVLCLQSDSKRENTSETAEIPSVFTSLECPFTWKFEFALGSPDIAIRIEEKLCELEGGDAELFPWKCFILNLILCFEYAKTGYLDDALEKQSLCDQILDDELTVQGSSTVMHMGEGLRHICLACKCHLLYASNMHVDAAKICDKIVPFDKLTDRHKASVHAAKGAYCAEYGYRGIRESVTLIEKAIDLDDCAEWFYLLGRSLGRLRRYEKRFAIPEKRELEALEISVEKTNNLSFMVLLAQTYRETSRCVFNQYVRNPKLFNSNSDNFKPYCDSLNLKSMEMYKKVLTQGKSDAHALIRCALGLMKLPKPWRDMDEAKNCILKALDLAPENPMANHVAGSYFSYAKDSKLAMNYFAKAAGNGVFGAEIDMIIEKKKINKSYDPLADLERLLHIYKEKHRRETVLCYLGTYYYAKNDIKTAFKHWFEVLEADFNSEALKNHFEAVSFKNKAMNINKVIISEILKLFDEGKLSESEVQFYNDMINKYIFHHPNFVSESTDIDLSKFFNRKFEYSSWKKEKLGWKYCITPSSGNRNEINVKSSDNFDDKNPGSDGKDKCCDGKSREMMAVRLGDNETKKDVASSLSQSIIKTSPSTVSTKEIEFEENSSVNQRENCVYTKNNSSLDEGKICGQIDQLCSENQE